MNASNDTIVEAWNTVLYEKFVRFRHLLTDGLARHSDVALQYSGYGPGMRVIDIGCGFGDTTVQIARRVGPDGEAVGVDCAQQFIEDAAADARRLEVGNARFVRADVQSDALNGPYDHAFARFGTMFFNLPGAAMHNVRRHLRPGGWFTQIVWRRREENPWLHEAELRVRAILPEGSYEDDTALHCGPGPFSMAGADMVSSMLRGAGFERIALERCDCDICIGRDIDDAVEFAMALGPAGEMLRLAGEMSERYRPDVTQALHEALAPFVRGDGVWAPSSSWFVRARNPG